MQSNPNQFLILRASAGSGKTYRLVYEYLRLALSTKNADKYRRILAVTFTNKAAQEMLDRVLEGMTLLSKPQDWGEEQLPKDLCRDLAISENELAQRASRTLEHMLHNYGDLSISTIDRFVNRVVRAFARDLKVTANYDIELDESLLVQEAVDRVLSDLERDTPLTAALVRLMLDRSEEERSWRIELELYATAMNLLNEKGHQNLSQQRELGIEGHQAILNHLQKAMRGFEKKAKSIGQEAMQLMTPIGADRFAGGGRGLIVFFRRLANLEGNYSPSATVSKNVADDKWSASKATPEDVHSINAIKDTLTELFQNANELLENEYGAYLEQSMIAQRITALGVLSEVENALSELKDENDVLLISDLNKKISQVVQNEPAPFIYERTGERYKNLLFDEFQDTSLMQWQNFLPLVENALSGNGYSLVVGDGKQAIYRWRNGEVQQFLNLPEIFGKDLPAAVKEKEATLKRFAVLEALETNWRSSPEVVEFNNRLFDGLASILPEHLKGIYTDAAQKAAKAKPGHVRLEEVLDDGDLKSKERVLDKLLEDIEQLLDNGFGQKDIAILVRGKSDGRRIAEHLSGRKIGNIELAVTSPDLLLLHTHKSVNMLMDLLACMYNPEDLEAATRFLGMAAEAKTANGERHEFMQRYVKRTEQGTHIGINELLLKAFGIEHGASLRTMPSFELACTLAVGLGLLEHNDPYIKELLNAILGFNAQRGGGLLELLEWWEKDGEKLGLVLPEDLDAIKLMTIHKSKGLQFPAVLVPFADWEKAKTGGEDLWLDDDAETYGLKHLLIKTKKELAETRFADQYQQELDLNLLDNVNLLYVAYTRAERVMISYFNKPTDSKLSKPMVEVLATIPEWDPEVRELCIGEVPNLSKEEAPKTEEKTAPKTMKVTALTPKSWYGKAVIDSSSAKQAEVGPAQLEHGKLVHAIMANIQSSTDIGPALNMVFAEGKLTEEGSDELHKKIQTILAKPEMQPFLSGDYHAMDEREILTESGKQLRPDRVLVKDDRAVIMEYKTGAEREEHKQQVAGYAKELEAMGYQIEDKLIIYIDQGNILRA